MPNLTRHASISLTATVHINEWDSELVLRQGGAVLNVSDETLFIRHNFPLHTSHCLTDKKAKSSHKENQKEAFYRVICFNWWTNDCWSFLVNKYSCSTNFSTSLAEQCRDLFTSHRSKSSYAQSSLARTFDSVTQNNTQLEYPGKIIRQKNYRQRWN